MAEPSNDILSRLMTEPTSKILADAISAAPDLPRCKHGRALVDWGGEISDLPCKCNWTTEPEPIRRKTATIILGLWP